MKRCPESRRQQGPRREKHRETSQRFAGHCWQGDAGTKAHPALADSGGSQDTASCVRDHPRTGRKLQLQRFPFSTVALHAGQALPGVQSSAGIKLLQPDTLQTHQSSSGKDYYFLSCLSLEAAFISLSPFCQNVSVSSFNKYHLRCLQPKGKQEKHFSVLLSNQRVASSSLPGAQLL